MTGLSGKMEVARLPPSTGFLSPGTAWGTSPKQPDKGKGCGVPGHNLVPSSSSVKEAKHSMQRLQDPKPRGNLETFRSQPPTLLELLRSQSPNQPWHPTPVLLPGKSHGQKSLVGCRPWGLEESDTTERLHFHLSLSCIGEGNGNPLQCSCLENPRDRGAWWAAISGVTQSQTQLKRLSSSRTNHNSFLIPHLPDNHRDMSVFLR